MDFKHILFFVYTLLCLHFVSSCFKKTVNEEKQTVAYLKKNDPDYIEQDTHMKLCVDSFTKDRNLLAKFHYERWINRAIKHIKDDLSEYDFLRFVDRKYINCMDTIAKHMIYRYLCPSFSLKFGANDLIYVYAMKEYDGCVANKNSKHITQLNFDLPNINLRDLTFDEEALLNFVEYNT
ncbi:hypothetical protein BDAP_002022 [Binucleata daphniae]